MSDTKNKGKSSHAIVEVLATIFSPETLQTYILGTKSSGKPRAIYDVYRDHTKPKKKKKKGSKPEKYSLYFGPAKKKGKKKDKNKKKSRYPQYFKD